MSNSYIHRLCKAIPALLLFMCVIRFPVKMGEMRLSMEVLSEIAVVCCIACLVYDYNRWISAFLLLALGSSFVIYGPSSYLAFRAVMYGSIWFYVVARFGTEKILDIMILIVGINLLFQFCQYADIPTFMKSTVSHYYIGLMGNPNEASALAAFCFPAVLRRKRWFFFPIILASLILAKCAGGILAASCGMGVFWLYVRPGIKDRVSIYHFHFAETLFIVIGGVSLCLYMFSGNNMDTYMQRLEAWKIGLSVYLKRWVLGYGIGHWKLMFLKPMINGLRWHFAHNEFVQMLFEMGIAFPIILIGYVSSILRRLKTLPMLPVIAVTVIAINAFFNFSMHIAPTAYIAVTWFGLMECQEVS